MQQAGLQQHLQHLRHAAGVMEVHRHKTTRGLEVAQHRHLAAHTLEIIDGPAHPGRRSNGQEVQHGIGGTTGGHDQGYGVLDGLLRDDVARPQAQSHGVHQHIG